MLTRRKTNQNETKLKNQNKQEGRLLDRKLAH